MSRKPLEEERICFTAKLNVEDFNKFNYLSFRTGYKKAELLRVMINDYFGKILLEK